MNAENLLKFTVKHITTAGGQESMEHMAYALQQVGACNMGQAHYALKLMIELGYLNTHMVESSHGDVPHITVTKKACDQIRAYNAHDRKIDKARLMNAQAHDVLGGHGHSVEQQEHELEWSLNKTPDMESTRAEIAISTWSLDQE